MMTTRTAVRKMHPHGIEKLEIGSGENPEAGYVHLDIAPKLPHLDIVANVRQMPIPDDFVSEIRAVHIMEHFCHPQHSGKDMQKRYGTTVEVLKECYRVLRPGGKLLIVTPDFHKISTSDAWQRVPKPWLQRWTVGGHVNEYDVHHWLWTFSDAYVGE
jgi:predicted SAM-dependent methyltransferase